MKKTITIAALIIAAIFLSGCVTPEEKQAEQKQPETTTQVTRQKITIAILPTQQAEEIMPKAKELENFLESRVNADIDVYVPMSYSAVVESLRFGHAQVGLMSAWPIAASAKLAGTDVVLSEVREVIIDGEKTNQTYYYSYYVVMKNSSYTKLEDLRGKRAVYASLTSTSGYLFPVAKLVEKGLISKPAQGKEADPREFFGTVATPGGYGPAWDTLKRGQADVGVIAGDVSGTLFKEIMDNTRVIETQGPIPSHGVVFGKNLKEPLRSELINAFMELNEPENNDLMRKLVSAIFVGFKKTSNEEHLAGLSAALNATGYKLTEKLG
ncbi:MAG: phosphate/phosphite/phosphonate ABC transporter substrate-binding protein [Candidatus Methanoperedens sp.]|nr:phosphate/phosphite/phosphonate ABC transporter substrate-binding protein [Candidatus Methanoperedens sp. BLZ2]KAB2948495.1 MAG: phosphate/phosphite/phosphonate ABC transporter substrate-binding protein [Candidatus Methanoperedens sp.]MBZ0174402.1 phosphate/phosphite/phosphonate ABC transporter substrate-binding protein [Candidatus Methanoperedens nitroreducens]MCX9078422.1 phosphate/phosphite/phosphonate ABC transporter substrate-binding protein [Candidatus Methanoperedens sp.]